jgi:hypothetical protein
MQSARETRLDDGAATGRRQRVGTVLQPGAMGVEAMIFFVMFLSGVALYIIGSAMDRHERAERERWWREWDGRSGGPGSRGADQ